MWRRDSISGRLVFFSLLGAACGAHEPAAAPITVAKAAPEAPPVAGDASPPEPEPPAIALPTTACVVTGDVASGRDVAFHDIFVGDRRAAQIPLLGDLQSVKIHVPERASARAGVEVEASAISLRALGPRREELALFPKAPLVRDGWLVYASVRPTEVNGKAIEPQTRLPPWLRTEPFRDPHISVACDALTAMGKAPLAPLTEWSLVGASVALEDDAGRKVATLDASATVGASIVKLGKWKTKVRFDLGADLVAEAWVPSRAIKQSPAVLDVHEHFLPEQPPSIECDRDVPLRVDDGGTTRTLGRVRSGIGVPGTLLDDGRVALSLADRGDDVAVPFVPAASAVHCRPKR